MSPIRFADRGVFAQRGVMPLGLSMSLVDGVSSEPDVEMNAAPEGSTPLTSSLSSESPTRVAELDAIVRVPRARQGPRPL